MPNNFDDVQAFHQKFGLVTPATPCHLDEATLVFRTKFLHEELLEFVVASQQRDLPGMADALVDLVYVALGTADLMGLPWDALWAEVQRANLSKVRAQRAAESKRGTVLDVVKPAGWVGPDIEGVLRAHTR